jgi:uncharacterized membrane protein YdjX (TVP38/TMEM64 family)
MSSKQVSRLVKGLVVLVIFVVLWSVHPAIFDFLAFMKDRAAVTAYLHGNGLWNVVLLELLLTAQVILAVIPGHIIMMASGYLYGFGQGLALNLIGTVGVSQIAFVVVRWAGRPAVTRLVPANWLNRWDPSARQQGFFFFLFCFWFPVVPSNVMNFVAALSSISFRSFLAANVFGRLPGVALVTLIGSHSLEFSARQWVLIAVVGGVLFLAGRHAAHKLRQRYLEPEEVTNE